MVSIIVIAILVLGIGFLAAFIIKSTVTPKRAEGIGKLIKNGKYAQAQKLAKQIIQKEPSNYVAHYNLGRAYLLDNKHELALMEYKYVNEHALFDHNIPEVEFRQQLAQLLLKFNHTDEALKEYLLLTKQDPTNAENFFNAGKIYDAKNKTDSALGFYQKCIQLNKKHVKAHAAFGLMLFKTKNYTEAKKEIDLAIKMSPETYSSYYYLGKILKEGKDYSGAVKAFEKAVRDPEFRQRSLIERGSCYMMANSMDNAMNEFIKAINASKNESSSETLYARYFLASCYEKARKIDKAIEQWENIYKHNRSFRDVPAKLSEYKDLQQNDALKEYLTCGNEEFIDICKHAVGALKLSAQQASLEKWGAQLICTEAKNDNWMNVRKQAFLVDFFRETSPVEDTVIRKILDEVKSSNCTKAFVCSSSGFTSSATGYAENRPVELIGKDKLGKILDKAINS